MVAPDRRHLSDLETERRRLDQDLGVKDEVIAVLQKRNGFEKSPRIGAITGVVLRQMEAKDLVLRRGQKAVSEPLPPWHAGFGRIQSQPARAEHDIGFTAFDDLAQVRDDGRVVLPVRVQHHDDVRAHVERLPVTGLLVAAIAEVALMPDHVEPERGGDADSCVGARVIDQEDPIGLSLGNIRDDLDQRLRRPIRGQHDHTAWPGPAPLQFAERDRIRPYGHPFQRQVTRNRERTDRG